MTPPDIPGVSVITPTYQRRHLVTGALASALEQTHADLELIVVDDGSTDGTAGAVEALARLDPRIRYRRQPNRGVAAARNAGLRLARGAVVAFLDSDDHWLPEHLAVVTQILAERPEAVLASTCPNFLLAGNERPSDARLLDYRRARIFEASAAGFVSGLAVRREAVLGIGGFDERLNAAEDSDLLRRLATVGPFALVRRRTIFIRATASSSRARALADGDYLAAAEVSASNLAAAVNRLAQPDRARLAIEVESVARLARAMRALDCGDDDGLRRELEGACRNLPLSDSPVMAMHRLSHLPGFHRGREERLRALRALAEAWPDRDALTARYLRLRAAGIAIRLGRFREAAALGTGWRLRGTARFARRVIPVLHLDIRHAVQGRRQRAAGLDPRGPGGAG